MTDLTNPYFKAQRAQGETEATIEAEGYEEGS